MSQLEYTNFDFTFDFLVVELLFVLNFKSLQLFSTEIQAHSHVRHLCHKWNVAQTLMPLHGY